MASQQEVDTIKVRLEALEQLGLSNVMPDPRGSEFSARNLAQVLPAMETYVVTLTSDPQSSSLQKSTVDGLIDSNLETARANGISIKEEAHRTTNRFSRGKQLKTSLVLLMLDSLGKEITK